MRFTSEHDVIQAVYLAELRAAVASMSGLDILEDEFSAILAQFT